MNQQGGSPADLSLFLRMKAVFDFYTEFPSQAVVLQGGGAAVYLVQQPLVRHGSQVTADSGFGAAEQFGQFTDGYRPPFTQRLQDDGVAFLCQHRQSPLSVISEYHRFQSTSIIFSHIIAQINL